MYFYYITMGIYVIGLTNIYSYIYLLWSLLCNDHPSYRIFYTFTNYASSFEQTFINFSILSLNLFYEILNFI
jgi:hypothetical protein